MRYFTVSFSKAVIISLPLLLGTFSPAHAVEMSSSDRLMMDRMNHEIKRLQNDLSLMQKEFYKEQTDNSLRQSNRPRGDVSSQVEVQLSEMQEQLRDMNGRVEEAQHHISKLQTKLDKALDEISSRLVSLEQVKSVAKPEQMVRNYDETEDPNAPVDLGVNPSEKSAKAAEEKTENADELAFKEAKKLLEQAQYEPAAIKFQTFVTKFKNSSFLPEAYYWQGELFSIKQEDENAAVSFLKAYQTDPKGDKAGESLVRLGGVLGNLGKSKEACTTFEKAEKEFPKLANLQKQLADERQRIGC